MPGIGAARAASARTARAAPIGRASRWPPGSVFSEEIFLSGTRTRPRGVAFATCAEALSRQEPEIVRLAVTGQTALEIAQRL